MVPVGGLDLQQQILKSDRVIHIDGPFEVLREEQVQIPAGKWQEPSALMWRRDYELAVELGQFHCSDSAIGKDGNSRTRMVR